MSINRSNIEEIARKGKVLRTQWACKLLLKRKNKMIKIINKELIAYAKQGGLRMDFAVRDKFEETLWPWELSKFTKLDSDIKDFITEQLEIIIREEFKTFGIERANYFEPTLIVVWQE